MVGFFKEFQNCRNFERSLNATFIALIPKKPGGKKYQGVLAYQLSGQCLQAISKSVSKHILDVVSEEKTLLWKEADS